jgi:hypothetical protein
MYVPEEDDEKVKKAIAEADTDELEAWEEHFDARTAHLPLSWLDSVRDMIASRREDIAGEASVAEQEAELEASFRGAVGSRDGSRANLAGRVGDMAVAQ